MDTATLDRFPGINNFIVCFYCNETFRSLSSLLKHCCSAEPKISLDLEQFESLSDTNSTDFDQSDSVNSIETSSDRPLDFLELEMAETDSNVSDVGGTSFSGTETEPEEASKVESNEAMQEISKLACASEKRLAERNSGSVKEITEITSAVPVKQLSATREDNKLNNEASKNQIPDPDVGQKVCKNDTGNEFNSTSRILPKASGHSKKQTNLDTLVNCSKSSSTEVEIHPHAPLHTLQSDFQKHNDTQMECIATDKSLSSETSCDTYGKNKLQEESSVLKHNIEKTKGQTSDVCSRPSPELESNSLSISRSSSMEIEMRCVDGLANSETSNSLPKNKSDVVKLDHVQKELNTSESIKSEENLNITKHYSEMVKSCYVKVQDIFKSILDSKVSTETIFSWKKKYHVCDVCNKFFRLRSDLNIHYLIHSTVKPYACNLCNKSFVKQCNLFTHHLVHTIKRKHVCTICKKTFLKKSLLLRHKLTHTKERPFTCQECDKSYASKWSLHEHYLTHSDDRPYICEICDATFANKRYLRKHYHSHQSKNNVCEFCFRTFQRKHHLEEHYNIHTNDRPHKCKICNKTFHLLLTLNNHYTMVHRDQYSQIFSRTAKTSPDCKTEKNPVIQKVQIATEVEPRKTPVVEKPSVVHIKKENISNSRARRKPLIPKRYLQPDKKFN